MWSPGDKIPPQRWLQRADPASLATLLPTATDLDPKQPQCSPPPLIQQRRFHYKNLNQVHKHFQVIRLPATPSGEYSPLPFKTCSYFLASVTPWRFPIATEISMKRSGEKTAWKKNQIAFCVVLHTLLVLGCWLWSPNGFNKCEFGPAPFSREGGDSFACASLKGYSVSPSEQQCSVMVRVWPWTWQSDWRPVFAAF